MLYRYHPYQERGHGLTTRRGKKDLFYSVTSHETDQTLSDIDAWQKAHRHLIQPLQAFSNWWKETWASFDNIEDLLEYLEGLCDHCLDENSPCACDQVQQ